METIISAILFFVGEMQTPNNIGCIPQVSFQMDSGEQVVLEVRTDHLLDHKEIADRIREEMRFKGQTRVECGTYHWRVVIR